MEISRAMKNLQETCRASGRRLQRVVKAIRHQIDKLPNGAERSRDYNRFNGSWRVVYLDGLRSEPMTYPVAKSYAEIFGGHVVHLDDSP